LEKSPVIDPSRPNFPTCCTTAPNTPVNCRSVLWKARPRPH